MNNYPYIEILRTLGPNLDQNTSIFFSIWGVHKLMILLRDLVKEKLQKIICEEMGVGQGDPDPLM